MPELQRDKAIVFFDGYCSLCGALVNFTLRNDPSRKFLFAALQGDTGREYLKGLSLEECNADSVVLIEAGRVYIKSTALLRVLRKLKFPWPLFFVLVIVPRPLRDFVYDFIARRRYDWWVKRDTCRQPGPGEKDIFLP